MTKTFHFVAAAFATILVCSVAGAQMRGGVSTVRVPSVRIAPAARSVPVVPRAVRQVRLIQISPTGPVKSGVSPFANSISLGSANGVPGLGFDYTHLAAISGGLHSGRSTNSVRGTHHRQANIVPILVGGYPYYGYGGLYEDASEYEQPQPQPQQQPQVIVIQQPVPAALQTLDSGSAIVSPAVPPAPTPVRDVGEFVLVRRDGRVLFASAFSVAGAQLTYVTPEGIRRMLPLTDLDTDATQQMNEARGTTVQIRN